jgi:hypothetical protein
MALKHPLRGFHEVARAAYKKDLFIYFELVLS